MKIFLLMKEGCLINGEPWFNGPVAECKPPNMRGIVDIREKSGKYHRIPTDQISFLGTVFRGHDIPMIVNLEESEADNKSDFQEGDDNLNEEDSDDATV